MLRYLLFLTTIIIQIEDICGHGLLKCSFSSQHLDSRYYHLFEIVTTLCSKRLLLNSQTIVVVEVDGIEGDGLQLWFII